MISRLLSILGAAMLLGMAAYHGVGVGKFSEALAQSDASGFIKAIFPVLFLNTSLYLGTLAAFALYAAASPAAARSVNAIIALSAFANAGLGAYLKQQEATFALGTIGVVFAVAAFATRGDRRPRAGS